MKRKPSRARVKQPSDEAIFDLFYDAIETFRPALQEKAEAWISEISAKAAAYDALMAKFQQQQAKGKAKRLASAKSGARVAVHRL